MNNCKSCKHWTDTTYNGSTFATYGKCTQLSNNNAYPTIEVLVLDNEFDVETAEEFGCQLYEQAEEEE